MLPFIHFFGIDIPSYGLMMVIGILCGSLMYYFTARARGIEGLDSFILSSYTLIAALLGAKILAILTSLRALIQLLREGKSELLLFFLLNGGMVFYGGVILGLITFLLVAKHHHISIPDALDSAAPAVALGHFFGRLGCFGVGCCYGVENHELGLVFKHSPVAPNGIALLPVQLYEASFNLLLVLVLMFFFYKKRNKPGLTAALYLILYGIWRFVIEFWRGDAYRGFFLHLSTSQWISLFAVVGGAYLLIKAQKRKLQ